MKPAMQSSSIKESAFDCANEALFIINALGVIIDSNRAAQKMLGATNPFPEAIQNGSLKEALYSTSPTPFRLNLNGRDWRVLARRLDHPGVDYLVVKVKPRRNAVKSFSRLNDRIGDINRHSCETRRALEASYQELDRFAVIAAHDLNAPLRQIGQLVSMMREDMSARLEETDIERFDLIEERTARLRRLIDALLNYSRTANAPLSLKPIRLGDIIDEVRRDLDDLLCETNSEIIDEQLPEVEADPVLTPQLFLNLISNSIKYHRPHTPPRIRIFSVRENDQNVICVADNGLGVDPSMAERIFQPFIRASDQPDIEGSGIGLSIVSMIAAKHNWVVKMESELGVGSTVRIALPR